MKGTCPNPGCDAVHTIDQQDIGRRSVCKTCGATFVIEADHLRLASDAPDNVRVPSPGSTPTGPISVAEDKGWFALMNEPFTWLMIAGTLLVIIFLFQPALDQFKIAGINAQIERLTDDSMARSFRTGRRPSEEEPKKDSAEVLELRDDMKDARLDARQALYTYMWFVMFGFIFLGVAEIGYLATGASKAKRVTGAILLLVQLVTVFSAYMAMSVGASFRF